MNLQILIWQGELTHPTEKRRSFIMNLQILIWQGELTHSTKWIRGKLKYCESYYKDNKKIVNKLIIC